MMFKSNAGRDLPKDTFMWYQKIYVLHTINNERNCTVTMNMKGNIAKIDFQAFKNRHKHVKIVN